ncbi:MAG: type I restriction endonuclease [Enterocloster bolteae]
MSRPIKSCAMGSRSASLSANIKPPVQFVDWEHPLENDFYIAEEVTIKHKRPDLVLCINGIAFAVIELKRSTVSMSEGIRQNLTNQRHDMIMQFLQPLGLSWLAMIRRGLVTVPLAHRKCTIFPGKKILMPKMMFP